MSRIRTIKPEWLEDDRLLMASVEARLLTVALIVMSDDYGRGRLNVATAARCFPMNPQLFQPAFEELSSWFVEEYQVRGQRYFQILNWDKHQKVSKPGKPLVPPPNGDNRSDSGDSDGDDGVGAGNLNDSSGPGAPGKSPGDFSNPTADLDHDLDHDQRPRPARGRGDVAAADECVSPARQLAAGIEARVSARSGNTNLIYRLLESLHKLHSPPRQSPVFPFRDSEVSAADELRVIWRAAAAEVQGTPAPPGALIAEEWLAFMAVMENRREKIRTTPIRLFRGGFGTWREKRDQDGIANPPAYGLEGAA